MSNDNGTVFLSGERLAEKRGRLVIFGFILGKVKERELRFALFVFCLKGLTKKLAVVCGNAAVFNRADRNVGILIKLVNELTVWSRVLVVLCKRNSEEVNLATFLKIVEHGQRENIVNIVSHVGVVYDLNGFPRKRVGGNLNEHAENGDAYDELEQNK